MRKPTTSDGPRVTDVCHHYDEGMTCGICGRPCVGHKVKIKVKRRGENREVSLAQYRVAVYEQDRYGTAIIDPAYIDHYEYCPIIKELMKCIQTVPSIKEGCENTSSLACPSDVPAV